MSGEMAYSGPWRGCGRTSPRAHRRRRRPPLRPVLLPPLSGGCHQRGGPLPLLRPPRRKGDRGWRRGCAAPSSPRRVFPRTAVPAQDEPHFISFQSLRQAEPPRPIVLRARPKYRHETNRHGGTSNLRKPSEAIRGRTHLPRTATLAFPGHGAGVRKIIGEVSIEVIRRPWPTGFPDWDQIQ